MLKSYGVRHSDLENILSQPLQLSDDVQKSTSDPSGLKFEARSESLDELEFFYSGSRSAASQLKRLLKNENEKQIRSKIKEYISNYLEERISRKLGNPRKFLELRNPLKRIGFSTDAAEVREPYFDCWSRLHTIHSHTQVEPAPDLACLVYHLIFDQTSEHILSASGDGLIKIYDKGLRLLKTVRGHKRDISILTVSSDNKFMISADEGGLVRVWEFPSARPVAVFTDQVGHDITTLHYLTETKASADGVEQPWRSYLMTTSPTAGFYIYEERNFINNMGVKKDNQEFINLSARIRDENGPLGFIASETNPSTGIIAAYSVKGQIYIWPRLSDMFGQENRGWPSPLKIIPGFHIPVEAALNTTQQQIILQWSPNGLYLFCANETTARILSYDPQDHSFAQRAEFSSDLQPPPYRRRGLSKTSFGSLNNSYVVVSFNLTSNSSNEQFTLTCLLIYDLKSHSLVLKLTSGQSKVNMATNTLAVSQHPLMEQICATTNTQGHIVIWDCAKGIALRIFVEHAGHVGMPLELNTVCDCNFSRCGNFLAVGTSYGSFSLYGYGGADLYQHVDIEQFTNMDFTPVDIFEETQEILCRGTGLTINSAEEQAQTFFCNLNLQQVNRLTTDVDLTTARTWIDEKAAYLRPRFLEMKKHDDTRNSEFVSVVANERRRGQEYRKKYREALQQVSDGDLWTLREDAPINVISTVESVPVPVLSVAPPVAPAPAAAPSSIVNEFEPEQRERDDLSDEDFARRRRLRRGRVMSESSVHEDDLDDEEDEHEDEPPELSESEESSQQAGIRTRRRRLLTQLRDRRSGRRRSQRLRTRGNQPGTANQRNNTGMNLRSSRAHMEDIGLGKRDPTTLSQNSDEDSAEFYRNFGKNRQTRDQERKKEPLPVVEEEHFCARCQKLGAREKCEGVGDDEVHGCHRVYHRDCSDLCGADVKNNTSFYCFYCLLKYYSANHRDYYDYSKLTDLEDAWLEMVEEDVDFLTPQIGDEFYFIWQPYESFVSKFFDILNFKIGHLFWPWDAYPDLQTQDVKVVVEEILYEYPEIRGKKKFYEYQTYLTTLMRITLRIIPDQETMDEGDRRFEIMYFPASDSPSFLIWHKIYERKKKEYQVARNFGDVKYGEEHYSIRDKSPFEDSFVGSLYKSLKIRAIAPGISTRHRELNSHDGEIGVSPWDVEFSQNTQILANTKQTLRKVDEAADYTDNQGTDSLSEDVKAAFEEFMQGPAKHAGPFLFQVDTTQYPDYVNSIRVHMYLMKIYLRVKGNYYRSYESLLHDVELMRDNAIAYNSPNSKIVEMAGLLEQLIIEYLDPSKKDPAVMKQLTKQIQAMNLTNPNFSVGNPNKPSYNLRQKQRETTENPGREVARRRSSFEPSETSEEPVQRRARRDSRRDMPAPPAPMKAGICLVDRKTRLEQRLQKASGTPESSRDPEKENPRTNPTSRVRLRHRLDHPSGPQPTGSGMALRRRSNH